MSTPNTDLFSFEHDGETYTFEKPLTEVRKPGFIRKNRHREELDLTFVILETVAGEAALAVIDEMDEDEFKAMLDALNEALGATLGE